MVMMATAIVAGNTIIALVVIGLATLGLLLLARDWLGERQRPDVHSAAARDVRPGEGYPPQADVGVDDRLTEPEVARERPELDPEKFEPDVAYDDETGGGSESQYLTAEDETNIE